MSASELLRVTFDLMAQGFAEASDMPLLSRAERHALETRIRRVASSLESLYVLPALEGAGAPAALYDIPAGEGA